MKTIPIVFAAVLCFGSASCGLFGDGGVPPLETGEIPGLDNTETPSEGPVTEPGQPNGANAVKIGTDLPITRAQVAKMLAFAFSDKLTIETADREITFSDTDESLWYDKYINAVFLAGLMSGSGEVFMPNESLTLLQAQYLLEAVGVSGGISVIYTEETSGSPAVYALWAELFTRALETLSDGDMEGVFGVKKQSIIPLASTPGTVVTDTGTLSCAGLSLDAYIDKEITALVKENEILALLTMDNVAPTIRNAYVESVTESQITVFSGGAERVYGHTGHITEAGPICDITVKDGLALSAVFYGETLGGTVKRVTEGYCELLDIGVIPNDDKVKVYDVTGNGPAWKGLSHIIVGSDAADFILNEGTVRAVILKKPVSLSSLRVLISDSGYAGYYHQSVSLTSDVPYTVWTQGQPARYRAGEVFTVSPEALGGLSGCARIYVTMDAPDGRIQLLSVARNWPGNESPRYHGFIEIARESDGRFTIVNEVPMEEYLYAVVPSEMPTSHGLEAAKVQAVTARSYAYNQYYANKYHMYGANIDDSVMCQVYNNIPENETSVTACDETRGLCLTYGGSVIAANFFSTSPGVTANSGEVWANVVTREFPSVSSAYLRYAVQYAGASFGNLSLEAYADAFFRDMTVSSYDSSFPWFRWNVTMTVVELSASINAALEERYAANPALIKTLQPDGSYRSRPIKTIGTLTGLETLSRGQGGNIMYMRFTGTEATIVVYTELNIRYLLKPAKVLEDGGDVTINRLSGGGVKNFSLMPSAFFVYDSLRDEAGALSAVTFYGGGYGHGVGMSQNGVKGMVDAGYGYEDILKHYYKGTAITKKW